MNKEQLNFVQFPITFNFMYDGVHCTPELPQFHESLRSWIRTTIPSQYWIFFYLILMAEEIGTFFYIYIQCVCFYFYKNKISLRMFPLQSEPAHISNRTMATSILTVHLNLSSLWLIAVVSLFSFFLIFFSPFSKAAFRNGAEKGHITSWSC